MGTRHQILSHLPKTYRNSSVARQETIEQVGEDKDFIPTEVRKEIFADIDREFNREAVPI